MCHDDCWCRKGYVYAPTPRRVRTKERLERLWWYIVRKYKGHDGKIYRHARFIIDKIENMIMV